MNGQLQDNIKARWRARPFGPVGYGLLIPFCLHFAETPNQVQIFFFGVLPLIVLPSFKFICCAAYSHIIGNACLAEVNSMCEMLGLKRPAGV